MKKLSFILGCFWALAVVVLAADQPLAKSELSTTVTESFQIRNKKFGDLLRPEGANGAVGTRIVLYPAEPWKCMTWKLLPAGEAGYHVQNHFTGKTFIAKADQSDTNVVQVAFARESGERPVWRFTKLADGSYQISEAKSGAALSAVGGAGQPVRIILAPWQNQEEQKWKLEKIDPATLTM